MKAREDSGRRLWLLLVSAVVLVAGCEGLIGIEDLSARSRADSGDAGGSFDPNMMVGYGGDGGEFVAPPPDDECLAEAPDPCVTSDDRPGLCGPGRACIEFCILDQSVIDQCLLQ